MEHTFQAKGFNELSTRELYDIMHLRQEVFVVEYRRQAKETGGAALM